MRPDWPQALSLDAIDAAVDAAAEALGLEGDDDDDDDEPGVAWNTRDPQVRNVDAPAAWTARAMTDGRDLSVYRRCAVRRSICRDEAAAHDEL